MSGELYDILNPWGPPANGSTGPEPGDSGHGMLGASGLDEPSRRCLDKVVLPPVYAIAHSAALKTGGGAITREALQKVLGFSGLPRHILGQIVLAADVGTGALTQRDFNLALAMTGLAQKNMAPSVESVMFHKDDLPTPDLDGVETLVSDMPAAAAERPQLADTEDDPWLSAPAAAAEGGAAAAAAAAGRTSPDARARPGTAPKEETEAEAARQAGPSIDMDPVQWRLDVEDVSIKEAAEKGGIVFKHTNYEVSTRSFSSMVVRRYNDFFWISNYLVQRYPFRMHPNIPPKGFADNRIKGLARFSNAVLRMPFLRRDALVIQFFSNTDEFAHVVKVGNLDTDAEEIDADAEAQAAGATAVSETYAAFDDFYGQVAREEEKYRTQITALEKMARHEQAIADEMCAYSDTIRAVNAPRESISGSRQFHVVPPAKRRLDAGLGELSVSLGDASLLERSHGEVLKSVSAENLRRVYDVVISMKLLMDRMRNADRRRDIQRLRDRLAARELESANADRATAERLDRVSRDDAAELALLEREQRCIEVRFCVELARYRGYESFLQRHYHAYVADQIKHHTLALNAWTQALATADELPGDPGGYIV
ncbi:Sorting nexin mvp1 [Coemansia sp. RSA 552]|nr:Sorting nexin mvp1 [Coemansia sp. RSA 552]